MVRKIHWSDHNIDIYTNTRIYVCIQDQSSQMSKPNIMTKSNITFTGGRQDIALNYWDHYKSNYIYTHNTHKFVRLYTLVVVVYFSLLFSS